jgi:uncharacterized membrane protein
MWLLVVALIIVGIWLLSMGLWLFAIVLVCLAVAVGWVTLERTVDRRW